MSTRWKLLIAACIAAVLAAVGALGSNLRARDSRSRHTTPTRPDASSPVPAMGEVESQGDPKPGVARIRVVWPDESPVPGALVTIRNWRVRQGPESVKADPSGASLFSIRHAGPHRIDVRADNAAQRFVFADLPGDVEVVMERGAKLELVPTDHSDASWKGLCIRTQSAAGVQTTHSIDRPRIDAGCWPPGLVEIYLEGGGDGSHQRIGTVAMPVSGVVEFPIRAPASTGIRVRLRRDSAAGQIIQDWTTGIADWPPAVHDGGWASLTREATSLPGVFELRIRRARSVLQFEGTEFAKTYFRVPSDPANDGVHEVVVSPASTLEVEFDQGGLPAEVRVMFVAPAEPPEKLPPTRHVWFQEQTWLGGGGPDADPATLDVFKMDASLPAIATLVRQKVESGRPLRIENLPSDSNVLVEATSRSGRGARAFVRLGAPGETSRVRLSWTPQVHLALAIQHADGSPADGAIVTVTESRTGGGIAVSRGTAVADKKGELRLHNLNRDSTYGFTVRTSTDTRAFTLVAAELDEESAVRTIRMKDRETRRVSVEVVDSTGRPASGIMASFNVVNGHSLSQITDANGMAGARVPVGHDVWAVVTLAHDATPIVQKVPPDGRSLIELPPQARGAIVEIALQGVAAEVQIDIRNRAKKSVMRRSAFVDGSGVVEFPTLPPGSYEAVCVSEAARSVVSFEVTQGHRTTVPVRIAP